MIDCSDMLAASAPGIDPDDMCDFLKDMDKEESQILGKEVTQIQLKNVALGPFVVAGSLIMTAFSIAKFFAKLIIVIVLFLLKPIVGFLTGVIFWCVGSSLNTKNPEILQLDKDRYLRICAKIIMIDYEMQNSEAYKKQLLLTKSFFNAKKEAFNISNRQN